MKIINGTSYNQNTTDNVIEVIENSRLKRIRIKIDYGHENGQSWGETNDVIGYVGRSTGTSKIPLLIHNKRSLGGNAILTHCIVRISTSKGNITLYQHKEFKPYKQNATTTRI